jgi:ATP-binding cassette subfamily B protein
MTDAGSALLPALPGLSLASGETLRAVFRPDLDAELRYVTTTLALTTARVCWQSADGAWSAVACAATLRLEQREHAGLGELRLLDGERTLARFFHTLAVAKEATELVDAFEAQQGKPRSRPVAPAEDDSSELPSSGRFPLLRVMAFARPHLPAVLVGLLLTLASTAAGLIPPYLTMPLVDEVLVPGQAGQLSAELALPKVALYLGGLAAAAVAAWLLVWAQGALLSYVTEKVAADLRNRAFAHLHKLSLEYFGGKRTGDLIARISSDTEHLCSFLSDTLVDFVTDVLMIVSTCVVLFSLDMTLAAAAVISFPPIAWLIMRIRTKMLHGYLRGGRVWSAMTNILADTIPGIRVVKAFSQERREIERFAQVNRRIVEINNRNNKMWTFFWPAVALLNQIGLLVVWAVGARQVLHHEVTVGVLTAFIAYIGRFYTRVESMSRMLTATQRASAAAQRLFEILDRVPSVLDPKDPIPLGEVRGEIELERVSFRYGSRLVLDDVSFRVSPGQMIGIVGHTGSGKSTVANLLCRFYDPSAGAVRVDGHDIRRLSIADYRKHIGIVLQEPFLFFGTIADNVGYGLPGVSGSQLIEAARAAHAHDFILKLPEGYDALVGERGQSLSGGERQRIAIARAILVDPRILLLDEATSAVDTQTEREIQRALDNVVAGRTTIAIAHRLSTLRKADLLLVIKDGRLAERGTHAELLALDGEYARLQRAQAATSAPVESVVDEEDAAPALPRIALDALALERDDGGNLVAVDRQSGQHEGVVPRRCFPLSHPDGFVSLLDGRGRDRICIEAPGQLPAEARHALAVALAKSEFLPRVTRIVRVTNEGTWSRWEVETDRGPRGFVVDQEDNIRRLDDGRHVITDSFGMRFLVPAPEQLDGHSRRCLVKAGLAKAARLAEHALDSWARKETNHAQADTAILDHGDTSCWGERRGGQEAEGSVGPEGPGASGCPLSGYPGRRGARQKGGRRQRAERAACGGSRPGNPRAGRGPRRAQTGPGAGLLLVAGRRRAGR